MSQPINLLTPTQEEQDDMLIGSSNDNDTGSTCSQTRQEDKIFDRIEDMLCEYMSDPSRHYLQFRVLRWSHHEDLSKVFTAIVVINPPMTNVAIGP